MGISRLISSFVIHKSIDEIVPLVLHKIVQGEPQQWEDVREKQLIEILNWVGERWATLSPKQTSDNARWLITFDDGYSSDYEIVFPLLQEYEMSATFFLITNQIDQPGYLTWKQVEEMHRYGMSFGSHSCQHQRMNNLSRADVLNEFSQSKIVIEDRLGTEVNLFSYPFGVCNSELNRIGLASGYSHLCTSDHGVSSQSDKIIPRNSIFYRMNEKMIAKVMVASKHTLFRWYLQDMIKLSAKQLLGVSNYIKLRNFLHS
jgi:peptidoglycan/xylan/chitin deacetylase (PgdA/CDA1 family)